MAIGDFLGKMYNSYKGTTDSGDPTRAGMTASFLGNLYDYYDATKKSKRAEEEARNALIQQQRIQQQQLALASERAAEESAMRRAIVERTAKLDQALSLAYEAMGDRKMARPEDIQENYQQIRNTMEMDLNRAQNKVASQGFANAISRGMDRSRQFRGEQDDLTRKFADQYRKMDQEAYNAAISRTGSYYDTLNSGREERLDELEQVYGSGIDRLSGAMPTNAGTLLGQAEGTQNTIRGSLDRSATDAEGVRGTTMANAGKYAQNLDYMLGRGDYENPLQSQLEEKDTRIADLENRIKDLSAG